MSQNEKNNPWITALMILGFLGYANADKIKNFWSFHTARDAPRQVSIDTTGMIPSLLLVNEESNPVLKINKVHPHLQKRVYTTVPSWKYSLTYDIKGAKGGIEIKDDNLVGKKKGWYLVSAKIQNKPKYPKYKYKAHLVKVVGVGFKENPWKKVRFTSDSKQLRFATGLLHHRNTESFSVTKAKESLYWTTTANRRYKAGTPPYFEGKFQTLNRLMKSTFEHPGFKVGSPVLCHHKGLIYLLGGDVIQGQKIVPNTQVRAFVLKEKRWKTVKVPPIQGKVRFAFSHPHKSQLSVVVDKGGQLSILLLDTETKRWKHTHKLGQSKHFKRFTRWNNHLVMQKTIHYGYGAADYLVRLSLKDYSTGPIMAPGGFYPGNGYQKFVEDLFVFKNKLYGKMYDNGRYYTYNLKFPSPVIKPQTTQPPPAPALFSPAPQPQNTK